MAHDTVVKESLSEEMIRAGTNLVKELDRRDWSVAAALWFYFSDMNQWKLLLASSEVARKGPREAYTIIQEALAQVTEEGQPVTLTDIAVLEPSHGLLQLLSGAVSTGGGISGIRFARNVIDGHFIDDAYIYRMNIRGSAPGVA
jgi:hypothetical protein